LDLSRNEVAHAIELHRESSIIEASLFAYLSSSPVI
jgi:hypothetical protein